MANRKWLDGLNLALLPMSAMIAVGVYLNRAVFRPIPQVAEKRLQDYSAEQQAALPFISIIVPARNEEQNLPRLLPSLLKLDYPANRYEVIVVNDNSEDGTGAILHQFQAKDARLKVVNGEPLPEDWAGKPHALVQGAAAAKGDWLLFTDADTYWQPAALLSALYSAEQHHADLFSAGGHLELDSFWEKVIMPIAMMGIYALYSPAKVNNPNSPIAIANGQFIFIKRAVYDAVGGFARVKSEIVEDLEFGKLIKGSGYRLWLADGRKLMAVRMYTSFSDVWQGWSKNVALASRDQPAMLVMGVVSMLGAGVVSPALPFVLSARLLARLRRRKAQPADALALAQSSFQLGMGLWYLRIVQRNLEMPVRYLPTFPLGAIVFTGIFFNSLYRVLSGKGVTWKGRTYQRSLTKLRDRKRAALALLPGAARSRFTAFGAHSASKHGVDTYQSHEDVEDIVASLHLRATQQAKVISKDEAQQPKDDEKDANHHCGGIGWLWRANQEANQRGQCSYEQVENCQAGIAL